MTEALLDELLVIDLSKGIAGGYCCLLFRYLGAEVVSVEPPGRARSDDDAHRLHRRGRTEVLPYMQTGKKSVTLDASRPEGVALLRGLAERADVLVSDAGLPPGLDYATLSAQNPRLVLTCVTGLSSNGDGHFWEYFTGLNAFTATLLPLVNMAILGRGQQVEVDGAECVGATAFVVDDWQPESPRPEPESDEALPPPPFSVVGQERGPAPTTPMPGEHNDEVYRGLLGLSGEELAGLKMRAII